MDLNESFATLFPESNQVWDLHSDCVIVQDFVGNEAGKKKRQESTTNAKKRRRLSSDVGRKNEKHIMMNLVALQDSAVFSVAYSAVSGISMAGEEIVDEDVRHYRDYAAPSCCSSNVPMNYSCGDEGQFFSPEFEKESDQSDTESCGSNSPEQEDRGFDVWDSAEELCKDDDGDWEKYLSPDIDYLLQH